MIADGNMTVSPSNIGQHSAKPILLNLTNIHRPRDTRIETKNFELQVLLAKEVVQENDS